MDAYKPTIMERLQRFPVVRNRDFLVGRSEKRQQAKAATADYTQSMLSDLDAEDVLDGLRKDGLACDLTLPEPIVDQLVSHAMNTPSCAYANPTHGFMFKDRAKVSAALGRGLLKSDYLNIREEIPVLKQLAEDPKLADVASRYLGFPAVCIRTRLWWSYASQADDANMGDLTSAAMVFHFDSADFRFMKFFYYLTDVGPDNGPHVFIKGTHRKKKLRHYLSENRHSDQEMSKLYGQENLVTITGKAGSGFAEDTFGFHKAELPRKGERLVLMLMFSHADSKWEDALGDVAMLPLESTA